MTAGQWVDRAINSALIAAGSAANRIMAATLPPADAYRTADMLAEVEERCECLVPAPNTCVDSGYPPSAVADDVEPAGAGASASAGPRPGAGGQSTVFATSWLLREAAVSLRTLWALRPDDDETLDLIEALEDRAAQFRAALD